MYGGVRGSVCVCVCVCKRMENGRRGKVNKAEDTTVIRGRRVGNTRWTTKKDVLEGDARVTSV